MPFASRSERMCRASHVTIRLHLSTGENECRAGTSTSALSVESGEGRSRGASLTREFPDAFTLLLGYMLGGYIH